MTVDEIGGGVVRLTLYGNDCEDLAGFLASGAQGDYGDPTRAETLSAFFLAAAITCRTYGMVNLSEDLQAKIQAIVTKVKGGGEEA